MVVTQRRFTAEEYLALPPEPDTQLIDGEVVVDDRSLRRAGAAEVWLADTESDTVLVFRGDEALEVGRGEQLATTLLPGPAVDLDNLFDR